MFYQHRPIKGLKTRITQTHTCHNVKMKTKQQQKLDTALKRFGQLEMLNTPRIVTSLHVNVTTSDTIQRVWNT